MVIGSEHALSDEDDKLSKRLSYHSLYKSYSLLKASTGFCWMTPYDCKVTVRIVIPNTRITGIENNQKLQNSLHVGSHTI